MRRVCPVTLAVLMACLVSGCAQNPPAEGGLGSAEAFFRTTTFVVTAPPDQCAEAQREARRSESPIRVLCRKGFESTSLRAGRPGGSRHHPGFVR